MNAVDLGIAFAIAVAGTLIGLAVVALIRSIRPKGSPPIRWSPVAILLGLGRFLAVLLLLAIMLVTLGPVGIIIGAIVAFVIIELVRKRRASQQDALLWLLVVSTERSMPLGPAIEAFAAEQGGSFAWRARRLAELLAAGTPLPDALELCPGLVPSSALPMVRIGSQTGALAAALRQSATVHNQNAPLVMSMVGKVSYLLFLPVFALIVIIFMMAWIIPKFVMIFRDYNASLPEMTRLLIHVSYFFVNYWYLFSPLILLFLGLLGYGVMRYFGWATWDLPLTGPLARRLDSAGILDGLAVVAQQQRPLADGIATLALSYPKADIRQRLTLTAFDIEAGGDWADSLARHDLIRQTDRAVLQAAQRAGNLAWAMQEMADSARRRFLYRMQAIVQAVFPAAVICFGLAVMFVVVSLFWPLVTLIQRLA